MNTYLVKFSTSSTGDTFGVLVKADTAKGASMLAAQLATDKKGPRKTFFYHIQGTYKVDADWR